MPSRLFATLVKALEDSYGPIPMRAFANDLMNRNRGKFKALLNGQPATPPHNGSAS